MVSARSDALTTISFRRDVRLFLATLIGFLVVLIFILVLLLKRSVDETEIAVRRERQTIVRAAAADFARAYAQNPDAADDALLLIRTRYYIPVVGFRSAARTLFSGPEGPGMDFEQVSTPQYRLQFGFDPAPVDDLRHRFLFTAAVCAVAGTAGIVLLLLYTPRITRPIEELLDHAREIGERKQGEDETQFLIDSFRRSIDTLKAQEIELKRLHGEEKRRADELEVVTGTLTRSLNSGFMAVSPNGTIVSVNAAGCGILGLDASRPWMGVPLEELGIPDFAALVRQAFASRTGLSREEIALGGKVVGFSTVPLFTEAGAFLGMIVLFADLTSVREMETRLRNLQTLAELGEMSAGIAHEFRNSLSTILGYLKLARRGELPKDAEERLRKAEHEADLLSASVDGLLSFARPVRLDRARVDVPRAIGEVVEKMSDVLAGVEVMVSGDPLQIDGDPALLSRVFENVIRNAVEAMHGSTERRIAITTSSRPRPGVTVTDTGEGVDPREADRYFLPFQSGKASGHGLGLAIARKIVLLHGGSIALAGEPGAGATVTITFEA